MTTLVDLIRQFAPTLSLYAVLLPAIPIALAIAKYFWEYEKKLIDENAGKLQEVLTEFRENYIEPPIVDRARLMVFGAYDSAIQGLIADLYDDPYKDLLDEHKAQEILGKSTLLVRLQKLKDNDKTSDEFFVTKSGDDLFMNIDSRFERLFQVRTFYTHAQWYCARTWWAATAFAILCALGLTQLPLQWHALLQQTWTSLMFVTFCASIWFFILLEINRRRLLSTWEQLRLFRRFWNDDRAGD